MVVVGVGVGVVVVVEVGVGVVVGVEVGGNMTQNQFLLSYLKSGKGITTLQAHRLGICRLSERCRELEAKGHKLKRIPKKVAGRFGVARVVEYRIG